MSREHVHLIGIGGTGMTALAGLLDASGSRVTGSDGKLYAPTSTILERLGLEVHEGFDGAWLEPPPQRVVIGNAISRGNPEVEAVLDSRLPYASMPALIEERFLAGRHSIVVAGTHGKTTTTSMLAWVLTSAGRDPSFLVGGLPRNFDYPFRLGKGPAFVIEGDEYDTAFFDKGPKFMHYRPDTALIGTIEFDHADIYRDAEQVAIVFRRLIQLVPRRGLLVLHADCPLTRSLGSAAMCRVVGYGFEHGEWRAADLSPSGQGSRFRVIHRGEPLAELELQVAGRHNALNSLAVFAAAHDQGLTPAEIVRGLAGFEGVRRRMESRGTADGVTVLDDFAHHPTAIDVTLHAVRLRHPAGRVWAVLEPRSWSMRRSVFQEQLSRAFDSADEVIVAPVYQAEAIPAAERLDTARLAEDLRARGTNARFLANVPAIIEHMIHGLRPGDTVVVMTNGAFEGFHDRLLEGLARRELDRRADRMGTVG